MVKEAKQSLKNGDLGALEKYGRISARLVGKLSESEG
jgi:hypothetical protein